MITNSSSDDVAQRMSKTFFALLDLADLSESDTPKVNDEPPAIAFESAATKQAPSVAGSPILAGLHYNVQIHLPATKDVEVYNAIFKSLREHFVD